jgi:hypothetical protein
MTTRSLLAHPPLFHRLLAILAAGTSASVAAADPPTDSAAPAEPGADAQTSTTDAPAPRYPRTVFARPLTLPAGLAMLGADMTANHDFGLVGATPIVGYGITDELEVQVPYAVTARDFEAKGNIDIDVGYAVLRGALRGKLEVIARVRGGYSLLHEAARPLLVGLHAQYNITDNITLITGIPSTQQLRISLADNAAMAKPVDFSVPFGVGLQATRLLYLQLDTKLAQLDISDSANAFIFADTTPVTLTAVYNVMNPLDILATIGTDLTNEPGDAATFLVGARYYAGEL